MADELGGLLHTLRQERNLSLRELARQAGVAQSSVSRWEQGRFLPRLPELELTLRALHATEAQRRQALALLDAPRARTQTRAETVRAVPDFVDAAGEWGGEGELLRALRARAGRTLVDTARAVGVTAGTLSRWERSEMRPNADSLRLLCSVLGATPEETAALTYAWPRYSLLCADKNAAQLAAQGLELSRDPAVIARPALADLVQFGLEAQAWRLMQSDAGAQQALFALYYWRMQTLFNTSRYTQAVPYVRRILTLCAEMPARILIELREQEAFALHAADAHSRALIYQAVIADRNAPSTRSRTARQLSRRWDTAYNVYYRAWMMSEAAEMLAKAGEAETALDWSRQACRVADTGDAHYRVEILERQRDHAVVLMRCGRSEQALAALEDGVELNAYHPGCLARYHLLRAEAFLNLRQTSPAHDALMQADSVLQSHPLVHLQPRAAALQTLM